MIRSAYTTTRLVTATAAVFALVLFGAVMPAAAADLGSTPITGVTLTPSVLADAGTGRIDFTWVAPPTAAPGDTFSIQLPDELEPASTRDIVLVDADTNEVAVRGVWSGKTATFTFESYLATHTGVHGTGFFHVKWDHSVVDEQGGTFDGLDIAGFTLPPVTKGAGAPVVQQRAAAKGGGWNDQTQTTFTWYLALPGSTAAALAGPVVLNDITPSDPGYTYDCAGAQLRRDLGGFPSPTNATTYTLPAAGPDVSSFDCSPTEFTLTFDQIPAGSFYTVIVPVTVTDPGQTSFSNTATFTWPAQQGVPVVTPADLRRDDAGGTVSGDTNATGTVCVGDYVWVDANHNGIQDAGEAGIPGVRVTLLKVAANGSATAVMSNGSALAATTNGSGLYLFCDLPLLQQGEKYRTAVAKDQPALAHYTVTVSGKGTPATDSSAAEGFADSRADLTVAGARDLTLDYGFVRVKPSLAESGLSGQTLPTALGGALLLLLGAFLVRRRGPRDAAQRF